MIPHIFVTPMVKVVLRLLLIFVPLTVNGQFLRNPSFEDTPGASITPGDWYPCNEHSTPDTQPGAWNVFRQASHGYTYLSLITRGINGDEKNDTKEAIGTMLKRKFVPNQSYRFYIDLSYASEFDDRWYMPPWKPITIKIYLGKSGCDMNNLIWTSPEITNENWSTYDFEFSTSEDFSHLILEANSINGPYNGNVLVDNIVIGNSRGNFWDHSLIQTELCSLSIPNVITPNEDGMNDAFTIEHDNNIARYSLRIYNRWGRQIFETKDISDVWRGETNIGSEAPAGLYFWIIEAMCIENNAILEDNANGTVTLIR